MKKLLLLSAFAVFGLSVNAQEEGEKTFGFEKGNIIVEGNLGFSSGTETDSDETGDLFEEKTSSFRFNPKAGYFISDQFAVGIQLSLNSSKIENTNMILDPSVTEETKRSTFGAGVFARYYFLELGKRFKTYGEFGLGFNSGNTETTVTGVDDPTQDYDTSGFNTGVGIGMNYFITECFAINFVLTDILSYSSNKGENNLEGASDETKSSGFNGNLNIFNNFFDTATFGLTYKF